MLLLCALPSRADEVVLRDGGIVRGEVIDTKDPAVVVIAVSKGQDRVLVEVPRAEVHLIRRLDVVEEKLSAHAQEALLAANPGKAVAFLEQLVARRPQDARAHRELGFALLMAGKPKDALASLQEACALDPIDVDAHLQLAQTYERTERPDDAIITYRKATRIGARHVSAWRALAKLLLLRRKGDDLNEALDALRRASKEDPSDEQTALAWAAALLPDRATEARQVLETFLRQVPQGALAARALAKLDAMVGRYAEARAGLAKHVARKDLPEGLRERLAAEDALYAWLGEKETRAPSPPGTDAAAQSTPQHLETAERRLAWQLELLPDDPRLQLALARVLLRAGKIPPARTFLERAALEGPTEVAEDALLLQQVAHNLQRAALVPNAGQGLLGENPAVPRARRLAGLAPWLEAAHSTYGGALLREGKFEEAAQAYAAGAAHMSDPAAKARLQDAAAKAQAEAHRKKRNAGT